MTWYNPCSRPHHVVRFCCCCCIEKHLKWKWCFCSSHDFTECNSLQVDLYLLPQAAFPTGGLYFKNKTWVKETKGMHVIIHNNYIIGFEKKTKRFRDFGFWLVDDHALESPLGRLWFIHGHVYAYCMLWSKLKSITIHMVLFQSTRQNLREEIPYSL